MSTFVSPGDLFCFVYDYGASTGSPNRPVSRGYVMFATPDRQQIPVWGLALMIANTNTHITWISQHGIFTAPIADVFKHCFTLSVIA
jgi:hypothetical protein